MGDTETMDVVWAEDVVIVMLAFRFIPDSTACWYLTPTSHLAPV